MPGPLVTTLTLKRNNLLMEGKILKLNVAIVCLKEEIMSQISLLTILFCVDISVTFFAGFYKFKTTFSEFILSPVCFYQDTSAEARVP